ncbi:hypothetical protein HYC85_017714 [Camellia sinensis]|uniref:Uncharacterized protein n=1 Tax=Camellia sinensis TaxID=4442 RepID=A0A7J7GT55_CAMSI|nr:hypothetical protein HYC85_017714 [Camellia sinensis]
MEGFNMEVSNPSSSSVCLCVSTTEASGEEKTRWYIINLNEAISILGLCERENVKKMEKEAKRRFYLFKKITDMFISGGKVEEMEEFFSTPLTPVCETPNMAFGCFWTTLGSVVYWFGSERGSHKVKYWDLADIQKGMEVAPPMISRRSRGKAVAIDGKIYVFGGTKPWGGSSTNCSSKAWAEVFDASNNEWKPLKQPSFRVPSMYLFLLPMHNEKIIIVGSLYKRGLYAYHVCQDLWDVVDEKFELISPYCDPVLAGHTLYWVGGDEIIHAYDLNEKKYFCGRIHFWALKQVLLLLGEDRCFPLLFFHLHDEMFCLIWEGLEYSAGREFSAGRHRSVLVVHQFCVSKRIKRGVLVTRVEWGHLLVLIEDAALWE